MSATFLDGEDPAFFVVFSSFFVIESSGRSPGPTESSFSDDDLDSEEGGDESSERGDIG